MVSVRAGLATLVFALIGTPIAHAQAPCGPLPPPNGPFIERWSTDADFDGLSRDAAPDLGADEAGQPLFAEGFESGGTSGWTLTST